MNKEKYLQIIAAFMINIIVLIPVAYAELTNAKVYGPDGVEGYVRNKEEPFTFEVNAKIGNETIDPAQVKLWGTSYDSGYAFTSCTENLVTESYDCILENLDLSGFDMCPKPQNYFLNNIYLYDVNEELVDTVQVRSRCDEEHIELVTDITPPIISNLRITYRDGRELEWLSGRNDEISVLVDIFDDGSGLRLNTVKADLSALNTDSSYASLPKTSCEENEDVYVCKWDVNFNQDSGTLALTFTAADNANNKAVEELHYIILVDDNGPVINSLKSDYAYKGKYFIGKNARITASITEEESGLNKANMYLDLGAVGSGNRVKAESCTGGWSCYWNTGANSGDGSTVNIGAYGEDDLGNKADRISREFTVDITEPTNMEVSTKPEFPTYKDELIFHVNVTEKNLMKVEVNTTKISETGAVKLMDCNEDLLDPIKYICYLDVGDLKTEHMEADVEIIATDAAGNKLIKKHKVTIYTLDTRTKPDFFGIGDIDFVPSFIDKQAASEMPISVFISPELKAKEEYSIRNPTIMSKAVDCSGTEHLSNTGYLLNEYTDRPYIGVKTATSITGIDEELFEINCTLTLRVQAGKYVYHLPEEEGVVVNVPLYNIPLGTITENVLDKIEESAERLNKLDKKIDDWEDFNKILNTLCTIAESIALIDSVLQAVLTIIEGVACVIGLFPWGKAASEGMHEGSCRPLDKIHEYVREYVWDPKLKPQFTLGYFFKWICMIHSGFICNANALGQMGIQIAGGIISGSGSGSQPSEGGTTVSLASDFSIGSNTLYGLDSGPQGNVFSNQFSLTGKAASGGDSQASFSPWSTVSTRTHIETIIDPSVWTWDPYKSRHYAIACLFLPGIIYNWRKEKQINCMKIKCMHDNVKLGLPIDVCEKAFDERYCLYVDGAQFKLHGWNPLEVLKQIGMSMLEDEAQLILNTLGIFCTMWDLDPTMECDWGDACATLPTRACALISVAQAIKNLVDIIDSGFNIGPYEDELQGTDYCADIDEYI